MLCTRMVLSPDGSKAALGTSEGYIIIYDVKTKVVLHHFKAHGRSVASISFSRDGNEMLTAATNESAKLWDAGKWTAAKKNFADLLLESTVQVGQSMTSTSSQLVEPMSLREPMNTVQQLCGKH